MWKKSFPSGVAYNCYKAANNTEIALQEKYNAVTEHYSHSLEYRKTTGHEGILLDLFDDGRVAYQRDLRDSEGYVIDVFDINKKRLVTLQPPAGCRWGLTPSVCQLSDGYAVVDRYSKSLTVLNCKGRNNLH